MGGGSHGGAGTCRNRRCPKRPGAVSGSPAKSESAEALAVGGSGGDGGLFRRIRDARAEGGRATLLAGLLRDGREFREPAESARFFAHRCRRKARAAVGLSGQGGSGRFLGDGLWRMPRRD